MMSTRAWVPADEVKGAYASLMEVREGVRWVLVSADILTDEQKAKYCGEQKP